MAALTSAVADRRWQVPAKTVLSTVMVIPAARPATVAPGGSRLLEPPNLGLGGVDLSAEPDNLARVVILPDRTGHLLPQFVQALSKHVEPLLGLTVHPGSLSSLR